MAKQLIPIQPNPTIMGAYFCAPIEVQEHSGTITYYVQLSTYM